MVTLILMQLGRAASVAVVAYAFGATFELSDLLRRGELGWFKGASYVVGALAALFGVGVLWIGHAPVELLFVAAVASWALRGRLTAPLLVMAAGMLAYWGMFGPRLTHYPYEVVYFLLLLVPLGLAHDRVRRTSRGLPAALAWFLREHRLHFYLLVAGYFLLFELDVLLAMAAYGFGKGHDALQRESPRARLRRLGVRV